MTNFHKAKKSAAVLKHEILDQYASPFASKAGFYSLDRRVAFIDGYAGPGRYDDGEEGSGAMLLRKAHECASWKSPRQVELHFVEKEAEFAARLREVAAAEGAGVEYTIDDGDISKHLPKLLESAEGIPLFAYLDPCGLIIPLDEVASIFDRPGGRGAPATEVLINLTAHLRRFGGILTSDNPVEASLKRIDEVCGGDWWREAWLKECPTKDASENQKAAALAAVVDGYAERLRARAGSAGTWIIDVRPRADLKPVYYLIFATRHPDGLATFGEAASLGLKAWRRYHAEVAAEGTLFANGSWEDAWKEQEAILDKQWVETLSERIAAELANGTSFSILERAGDVLGDDLAGLVRGTHFRKAINKVRAEGKTATDPKGVKDLWNLKIKPL